MPNSMDPKEKKPSDRPQKTITRADLSEVVYKEVGLSRADAANMVEVVLREITAAAANGQNVKLSSFGTFVLRSKKQRIGRNPKTGEEVPITPRRVLTFKPSNIMKRRINGEAPGEDDDD